MSDTEFVDVLICGGGPVGLLTGLGLSHYGVSTIIVEKRQRSVQEQLGRACMLFPRSVELIEAVAGASVVEKMLQVGFHGRAYAVYKEGKAVTQKAWQGLSSMLDTSFHNYIMNIRQSESERIFTEAYQHHVNNRGSDGGDRVVRYGWRVDDIKIEDLNDGYNVTALVSQGPESQKRIRCSYLVGSDGGHSTVRQLANILMEGNETTYKWVRLDGKYETNMPEPYLPFVAMETKNHGNIFWAKLDEDASRIGFALTPRLQEKYPNGITEEEAVNEAKEAMLPFSFHVKRVDWWTQYNVKQKVAETFQKDQHVILAGDAAHTHSSAFAQGMNTGIHDATNLVWKLAGTIKGWYHPKRDEGGVLSTYSSERHGAVTQVVNVDRAAAAAVSGDMPAGMKQIGMTVQQAFESIWSQNLSLTLGLGISYEKPSVIVSSEAASCTTLIPGARSPDALLKAPGSVIPVRLHETALSHGEDRGKWTVLVFVGYHHDTKNKFVALRDSLLPRRLESESRSNGDHQTVPEYTNSNGRHAASESTDSGGYEVVSEQAHTNGHGAEFEHADVNGNHVVSETGSQKFFRGLAGYVNFSTILIGHVGSAWEAFDGPALGNVYFDTDAVAHSRYGISPRNGGLVVVRPDRVLAFGAGLHEIGKVQDFLEPVFAK